MQNDATILTMRDEDAEFSVISTLISHNELWGSVSDILKTEVFYDKTNAVVFSCVKGVLDENGIADVNAIVDYHKKHPTKEVELEKFHIIGYNEVNPITFKQNVDRIVDLYKHRKAWETFIILSNKAKDYTKNIDTLLEESQSVIKDIGGEGSKDTLLSMADVAKESMQIVEDNNQNRVRVLFTGFTLFDDRFILRPTTLTIIAAFSSVGKSALALNIAENVARTENAVAYYTKEMANVELFNRMVAYHAQVSANYITNKRLNHSRQGNEHKSEYERYTDALNKVRYLPIYFDQGATTTFEKTIRSIRNVVKTKKVKLVIIDYLQIFAQTKEGGEESSLGYMARELKNIAKELEICVIALSQISRPPKANDKLVLHPRMRGLRGSGQLEESADSIILIDRPEVFQNEAVKFEGQYENVDTKGKALFLLTKGRGSGQGESLVGFEGRYTRYYDIDPVTFEEIKKEIGQPRQQVADFDAFVPPPTNDVVPEYPSAPTFVPSQSNLPF